MADIKISALPTATTPLTGAELVPIVQSGVTKQTTTSDVLAAPVTSLTASSAVATDASKKLVSVTNTGTGDNVLATSPTLVTPILGTPQSATLTNATGLPIGTGVSGLGTGVATALAVNVGTAGSPVVNGGALGTPSSGTVTNLTGTANITATGGASGPIAATTLSASSTVSGTGFSTYLASPPAIGGTTPAAGTFTSQNDGQLAGLRNRIINGGMTIDQRNAGAAVTPTGIGSTINYSVDRFGYYASVASKLTFQQVADAPTGFKNSLKITVASQYAPLAADYFNLVQQIEGFNCIDLALGTASASAICVSLWVKGSVAGTYSVALTNSAGSRSYVGTVSVTTSWAKQTVTLTGDTTGTWLTDSGVGLSLRFDFGSGSNVNATAGSWQAGTFLRTSGSVSFVNQTAGATLNITGVQLEIGSTATPFEQRPYGMELALCQRYYYRIYPGAVGKLLLSAGSFYNNSTASLSGNFNVSMRVAPSALEQSGTANHYQISQAGFGGASCTSVPTFSSASVDTFIVTGVSTGAVFSAGYPVAMFTDNTNGANAYLGWSAEL